MSGARTAAAFDDGRRAKAAPRWSATCRRGSPTSTAASTALRTLVDAGCDVIEVGLPYSDPVMDGPTIQAAAQQALDGGVRTRDVLRTVEAVAATGTPTVVMTYWNPVERYGVERFAADLASRRGAGLITPDLTPDSARRVARPRPTRMTSTRSSWSRRPRPTHADRDDRAACRGFVYATAVMGVTGARATTSELAAPLVARTKAGHRPPRRGRPRRQQRRPGRRGGLVRRRGDRRHARSSGPCSTTPTTARPGCGAGRADRRPCRGRTPCLERACWWRCSSPLAHPRGRRAAVATRSSTGAVLDQPYVVPATALTDTDGASYSLADSTDKRLTLVFFGYTNCPDICQVVMATLASAMTRLDDADREQVDVVFVTTDPARDDERSAARLPRPLRPVVRRAHRAPADHRRRRQPPRSRDREGREAPQRRLRRHPRHAVLGIDSDDEVPIVWTQGTSATQFAADVHQLLDD